MKLVILDRDGTINHDRDDFVKSPEEWVPLPGALEAIARLNQAGWHVVLASNQSGIGRGLLDVAALNAIHAKMHQKLARLGGRIDAVFFCPHTGHEACTCRKPLPGLFVQIAERLGVDLSGVVAAGDGLRDLQAAAAAGCEPHLVLTGKATDLRGLPLPLAYPPNTQVHEDLPAFADHLIARGEPPLRTSRPPPGVNP